ncbi:hypothetical protein C9374_012573 [Naegleria lovaniensis]|uniref:Uncharacterized protein n=1 Tax=Naegleria lovaniensis TaxID=51637 RepID=A0AA88H3I4_NAELO|nr:uncharacterized protein C9374_012573 [Naegleria lovaniensis]KAG2392321.1 hypothetical protein C9374_012573 [Naegleria lovaniensis]
MSSNNPTTSSSPSEVDVLKQKVKDLENENIKLKAKIEKLQNANANIQLQVEEEEELITNKLMKKLNRLKKEKETLAQQVEEEEELLTNTLQKQLEKLLQEKTSIENQLKQDKEYIVTKLRKQLEDVLSEKYQIEKQIEKERSEVLSGVQTILQNIKTDQSNQDVVQKLIEQVEILNREQQRLAHDSEKYRQKNLALLKEYSRLESENFILEQKILREKEKRKEIESQKLKDEFDLEISSEREFNQTIKNKSLPLVNDVERSRRSHSLPPSSQPPEIASQLGINLSQQQLPHVTSPLRGSSLTPRGNSVSNIEPYISPRKPSFSPSKTVHGIPIPGQSTDHQLSGLSSSLPTHNYLMGSSFAERLSQIDPYQTNRAMYSTSPRLGSASPAQGRNIEFVRQSPRR